MLAKIKIKKGFTLVEVLIGVGIFVILVMSVYQAFTTTMNVVRLSRTKITATALANEQFEIMRNLPYADVGIIGGLPNGKIASSTTLIRDNKEFLVKTTIRSVDDPFDGTIGGTPNDTSPADYKLAEVEISCSACQSFSPVSITTHIAPKNLESSSTNGALFIKVFDSAGQPIPEADIHIENNQSSPTFSIDDVTNNDGLLQIVDAPPGAEAYEISVSKNGYTSEQTFATGDPVNPNPNKSHATVLTQQLTEISFIIDQAGTLEVTSSNDICTLIPNVDFTLKGTKLIGTDPSVFKFNENLNTDENGENTISDLDGDTYNITFNDVANDLSGAVPSTSFILNPGAIQTLKLLVTPKNPKSLLITVKDAVTNLPLSDVTVKLTGTDYENTLVTGRGYIRQTDWAGGAGQEKFLDITKYFDSDGNLEITTPSGELKLKNTLGEYAPSAWLISSTFDTGTNSNFHQILWQNQDQPAETGPNSVRLQIATNNDNTTWDFIGPDGTADTYYTSLSQEINPIHDNDRYLRYKIYLTTADPTKTPTISDISFTFTSDCLPPGQVFFNGLLNNIYNVNISKDNYETYTDTINTSSDWQQSNITLSPQ